MAATRARGCTVATGPALARASIARVLRGPFPLMSWQSKLKARRSARRYGTGCFTAASAVQVMHDRVVNSLFAQSLCDYRSEGYARHGRAVVRQEMAFSRLLRALAAGAQ
jgi:hypothetical protein